MGCFQPGLRGLYLLVAWVLTPSVVGTISTSIITDVTSGSTETIISPSTVYRMNILHMCTHYLLMFMCTGRKIKIKPLLFYSFFPFRFIQMWNFLLSPVENNYYSCCKLFSDRLLSVHNVSTMKWSNIYGRCVRSMKSCRSIHISFTFIHWCEASCCYLCDSEQTPLAGLLRFVVCCFPW